MIEFGITNQIITRKDEFRVVGDSRNYLKAKFEMSEEWQHPVVVLFGYGEQYFQTTLDDEYCCKVPFEVIKPPFFTVSAFCGEEELVTANKVFVDVEMSGLAEGKVPEEPTPSVFQQYVSEMHSLIEKGLPFIGENGNWFLYDCEAKEYKDTGVGAEGKDGIMPDVVIKRNADNTGVYVELTMTGNDGTSTKQSVEIFDGKVPKKGVDYWTETDKAEMVETVIEALPDADKMSFPIAETVSEVSEDE